MSEPRSIKLRVFRSKDGITDPDVIIPERTAYEYEHFQLSDGRDALVYYTTTPVRPPRWATFFDGIVDPDELRSASSSAVILFQEENHCFVFSFGYARKMINLSAVEARFGLRATLNGIDPEQIRSLDRKTVEAVSRLTREQASRNSSIHSFGLNVQRDLLNSVTAVPRDESLGSSMTGRDSVNVTARTRIGDIWEVSSRLDELAAEERYQEHFPWVDNIREIRDPSLSERLDREVVRQIKVGDLDTIWLSPPNLIDWEEIEGFQFNTRKDAEPQPELEFDEYHSTKRERDAVTVDILKGTDRVYAVQPDGTLRPSWSFFRCLTGEIEFRGDIYAISDGTWYKVGQDFRDETTDLIESLPRLGFDLPPYGNEITEEDYIQRVAEGSDGLLAPMDQVWIHPREWYERMEFCDLYHTDGVMVNIKRFRGSSQDLSHLFHQGANSARSVVFDKLFRDDVNEKLPETHEPLADVLQAEDLEVAYAIVCRPGREFHVPFFSSVSLRNNVDLLQQFGFRVSLTPIDNLLD